MQARYGIGSLFLTRGKINEAINQFMTVLKLDPQHVQAKFSIGKCLEKKNQPGDALQDYRNIEASIPDCIEAYLLGGPLPGPPGPDARCGGRVSKSHRAVPSRLDIRIALIRLLEEQGYIEEAIKEYREILAWTPDAVDIRLDMASVMDRGGPDQGGHRGIRPGPGAGPQGTPSRTRSTPSSSGSGRRSTSSPTATWGT